MILMRKNYDKPHRCPGWSGPALRGPSRDLCPGGSLDASMYAHKPWKWRFHRHSVCGVVTLPYVLRWLQPDIWALEWRFRGMRPKRRLTLFRRH